MGDDINKSAANTAAISWTVSQCIDWARQEQLNDRVIECIFRENIDGKCLLTLNETDIRDLRYKFNYKFRMCDIKHFSTAVRCLQRNNQSSLYYLGLIINASAEPTTPHNFHNQHQHNQSIQQQHHSSADLIHLHNDVERVSPPLSVDGRATCIRPEFFKTMISLGKFFIYFLSFNFIIALIINSFYYILLSWIFILLTNMIYVYYVQ